MFPFGRQPALEMYRLAAQVHNRESSVTNASLIDNFVYKVDVTMPASLLPCAQAYSNLAVNFFYVTFSYNGNPVGPRGVPIWNGGPIINLPNEPRQMTVWVTK